MLFLILLVVTCFNLKTCFSQTRNDTLLTCYICMELENTVKQECDKNRPQFHTCIFTKDLINWTDVEKKLDSQVTFNCLLLYYKEKDSSEVKSLRGCIAEYKDYHVCEHLAKITNYEEEISCVLCGENNCNIGFTFNHGISLTPHRFLYFAALAYETIYKII